MIDSKKYENGDIELSLNEFPKCPYCGNDDDDEYYLVVGLESDEEVIMECVSCDKSFKCITNVERSYTTERI